jgi:hypothetical protein
MKAFTGAPALAAVAVTAAALLTPFLGESFAEPLLQIVPGAETASIDLGPPRHEFYTVLYPTYDVAALGDGGFIVAWTGQSATRVQRYTGDLRPLGRRIKVAGRRKRAESAKVCGRIDGSFVVVWDRGIHYAQPIPSVYLNPQDAIASQYGADGVKLNSFRVHRRSIGVQSTIATICSADGGVGVLWADECAGYRFYTQGERELFYPEQCGGHRNDMRWNHFPASGSDVSPERIVWSPGPTLFPAIGEAAELSNGDALLIGHPYQDRLRLIDGDGSDLREYTNLPFLLGDLDCRASKCAAISNLGYIFSEGDVRLLLFDPFADADPDTVTIDVPEYVETPGAFVSVIYGSYAQIACDIDGLCLVTWIRIQRSEFEHHTGLTALDMVGRALNIHTGALGPETHLQPVGEWYFQPTTVTNIAPGRFVVGIGPSDRLDLRVFEVK